MDGTRKFALNCVFAAIAMTGVAGCQTASRFAFFGKPKETPKPAPTRTVSHTESADDRLMDSFYTSVEASRLEGNSISHLPPGRDVGKKKRNERTPGQQRPDGAGMPQY